MKNQRVVFINGPINSGKTTAASILAREIPDCVYLDGDHLVEQEKISLEDWINSTIRKVAEESLSLVRKGKLPIIAFPLRDKDWEMISGFFARHAIQPICITLSPSLETVLSQRLDRQLHDWESKRIEEMYNEGYQSRAFSDLIIQNDNESPQETGSKIRKFLFV